MDLFKLLVVEDDPVNQTVVSLLLNDFDVHFDIASTGEEALALELEQYHLVLIDLGLPDMNGAQLNQMMLKRCPGLKTVALTAHVTDRHRQMSEESGMKGFYSKPITRKDIEYLMRWVRSEEAMA